MSPLSWFVPPVNAGFLAGAAVGTAVVLARREQLWVSFVVVTSAAWAAGSLYRSLR